jgi:hypothetical protein
MSNLSYQNTTGFFRGPDSLTIGFDIIRETNNDEVTNLLSILFIKNNWGKYDLEVKVKILSDKSSETYKFAHFDSKHAESVFSRINLAFHEYRHISVGHEKDVLKLKHQFELLIPEYRASLNAILNRISRRLPL